MKTEKKVIASVDIGEPAMRDREQTEIKCKIYLLPTGQCEAVGTVCYGENQGYYPEDFFFGPWPGRGDTPKAAVQAMLDIVDSDHLSEMREAGQSAQYEADDTLAKQGNLIDSLIESWISRERELRDASSAASAEADVIARMRGELQETVERTLWALPKIAG